MDWVALGAFISVGANLATAVGLWFLVRQVRNENRVRAKEASQAVWDFLAAEEVYMARLYLEYHAPPANFDAAMRKNSPWMRAALKCYLAYQKAAILVIRHEWMNSELFAQQWGHSTLVVWDRLKPWIDWYGETRSYPGFGDSIEKLVAVVNRVDDETLGFRKIGLVRSPPMTAASKKRRTICICHSHPSTCLTRAIPGDGDKGVLVHDVSEAPPDPQAGNAVEQAQKSAVQIQVPRRLPDVSARD